MEEKPYIQVKITDGETKVYIPVEISDDAWKYEGDLCVAPWEEDQ